MSRVPLVSHSERKEWNTMYSGCHEMDLVFQTTIARHARDSRVPLCHTIEVDQFCPPLPYTDAHCVLQVCIIDIAVDQWRPFADAHSYTVKTHSIIIMMVHHTWCTQTPQGLLRLSRITDYACVVTLVPGNAIDDMKGFLNIMLALHIICTRMGKWIIGCKDGC